MVNDSSLGKSLALGPTLYVTALCSQKCNPKLGHLLDSYA